MASQKQVESIENTRKGDSYSQVPALPFTMVAGRRQCSHRATIIPNKTCSTDFYRHTKRRVGYLLQLANCKRNLAPSRKTAAYKLFGTKSSLSSLKGVPRPLLKQDSYCSYQQHHCGVIHKQGRGMRSGPLCALLWKILTWCTRKQVNVKARHIPGWLNIW